MTRLMNVPRLFVITLVAWLGAAPGGAAQGVVSGEVLVELKPAAGARVRARLDADLLASGARTGLASLDALAESLGVTEVAPVFRQRHRAEVPLAGDPSRMDVYRFRHASDDDLSAILQSFRTNPHVAHAQPNFRYEPDFTPNDDLFGQQVAHVITDAELAWDIERGESSIVIAVIGTGVDWNHEDLEDNIWNNPADPWDATCTDDDGNGFGDDFRGWDFRDASVDCNGVPGGNRDPMPDPNQTAYAHETLAAGIAAAVTDNVDGIAGVAHACKIMPLQVDFTSADVAQAIDYAVSWQVNVINMSFGNYASDKYGPDSIVFDSIQDAFADDIVMVSTAGNDRTHTERYPGALDEVICVGATDNLDLRWPVSNFGRHVDLAAPGESLQSTQVDDDADPDDPLYGSMSDTSAAAAYVSGAAALIASLDPTKRPHPDDVRKWLEHTADPLYAIGNDPFIEYYIGSGRIDLEAALKVADGDPPPTFGVIESPHPRDALVTGTVELWGTVAHDNGQYRVRHRPVDLDGNPTGSWTDLVSSPLEKDNSKLVSWDTALLSVAPGWHDVLLLVQGTQGLHQHTSRMWVYKDGYFQAGWPVDVQLPWTYAADYHSAAEWQGGPTFWDLDGDEDLEVIAIDRAHTVHVWHHDGEEYGGEWPRLGITPADTPQAVGPAVGDIDGDGSAEIVVVPARSSPHVYAYNHDGSDQEGTGWPQDVGSERFAETAPALGDLVGDASFEVVAVTREGTVHAWDGDGDALSGFPVTLAPTTFYTTPAIGDVDGDADMEIVVRSYAKVFVIHHDGTVDPNWPATISSWPGGNSTTVLADFTDDAGLEIAVASRSCVHVYESDGSEAAMECIPSGSDFLALYGKLACADLDANGDLDVLVADQAGRVYAFTPGGQAVPGSWPVATMSGEGNEYHAPGICIADVDGDGGLDVISGSADHYVHAWDDAGTPLAGWPKFSGGPLRAAPSVVDLDCDGDMELVIGNEDLTQSKMFVFDLAGQWDADSAPWPTENGVPWNAGTLFQNGPPHPLSWLAVCESCADDPANDADGDTVCDADDNCPNHPNTGQEDHDDDGVGNCCQAGVCSEPPTAPAGTILNCYTDAATAIEWAENATRAAGPTDDCSEPEDLTIEGSLTGSCPAIITVTVTDECGHSSTVEYCTHLVSDLSQCSPLCALCP